MRKAPHPCPLPQGEGAEAIVDTRLPEGVDRRHERWRAAEQIRYLNRFVETGKISFLIQFAVCRAGLIGVSVPPPLTIGKQHDSEEDLSVSARTAKSPDGSEYSDLYMSKRTKVTGPN